MKKIKVLHITKMKGISGSENHLFTLLSEIDPQRFHIELCILAEACHVEGLQEFTKTLEQFGVAVTVVVMPKYGSIQALRTLKKYIIAKQIDIVHTHLIHADFYGTLAAKLAGVSTIISSRHNDDKFRYNRILIWLNRVLARWQSKIIVISDWVGEFLQTVEGIDAEKIVRIHYGLQPETIIAHADPGYARQHYHIPADAPVIGTIGRLSEQKGHRYLLQAIHQVKQQVPDLRMIMIGDGELRQELTTLAQQLHLEETVIFSGAQERNTALRLLSGCDFFVFPSLWEGFGLVLLEAMALKKAIVASQVSAIPESVVHGETGFLVPPKDPGQLAEAILKLLQNPALRHRMGEAGYTRLHTCFSVANMVAETENLYIRLIKR